MMGKYQPPTRGSFKVKPGKRTIWLARPSSLSLVFVGMALGATVLSAVAAGVPVVPWVWYHLKPSVVEALAFRLHQPAVQSSSQASRVYDDWQPSLDESLPQGGWIKIPSIKVSSEIYEAPSEAYESALEKGIWRVPEFGTPIKRVLPTILVAHRYGYLKWSNIYRRDHSFYNLPEVNVGDEIEIDWGQRRYVYRVYAGDQGTQITDYSADLILYTCQFLESDQRIFKYARLIKE
jgi:sortase (surface protein transpeptidase)